MIYNKITLAFPQNTERLFRRKYFSDSLYHFRVAFLMVTIIYVSFGYLDIRIIPEYASIFHTIRFYIVGPLFTIVWMLSFTSFFRKVWQVLLFICFIVGGAGISVMTMLAPDNYAYYAGLMLVLSAGYFFIKLRFFWATIAGWLTLIIFNLGAIFYTNASTILLLSNNFFFVSANLIGMFAAYSIEFYTRRNFYLNQELDKQVTIVKENNKNLEKTIEERTRELVEAKNIAEQSDRSKSAFLANMSHEIRTPMNSILGFADLLKQSNLSDENQYKYLTIIEKSGDRMLGIINDIIDITRIEAGLIEVNFSNSNINDQINNVYSFLKLEAEIKGIKLSYSNPLPNEEAIIYTDREKLYAIIINLVKNAIKYTDKGRIEFGYSLKPNDDRSEIEFFVKDTGIGIPRHLNQAIFDRFVQADIKDRSVREGTGLGLSISKAYVEMLGGRIWVESQEGVGSTFYFSLPYSNGINDESQKKIEVKEEQMVTPNRKLKILVVEDDDRSEILISALLENIADTIIKATNGEQALTIVEKSPDIDLVLMDIQMPRMNGYEATRRIREFNRDVVIIAQTAFALSGDREKALEAGCNDYITKPIIKKELLAVIEKYT